MIIICRPENATLLLWLYLFFKYGGTPEVEEVYNRNFKDFWGQLNDLIKGVSVEFSDVYDKDFVVSGRHNRQGIQIFITVAGKWHNDFYDTLVTYAAKTEFETSTYEDLFSRLVVSKDSDGRIILQINKTE